MDPIAEVFAGRISVQASEQAAAYINKLIGYEDRSPDGFANSMLAAGDDWGDYTGLARNTWDDPGFLDHQPIQGSEFCVRYQYRHTIQPYWQAVPFADFSTSYTSWDTNQCGDYDHSFDHLRDVLSWGYNYVYFHGHADGYSSTALWPDFNPALASELTNAGRPSIVFVEACSTSAFDLVDPTLGEAFIRNPNGGAVAYLGYTRAESIGTGGYGTFFREVFAGHPATIGEATAYTQLLLDPYHRYVLNLQGDPALLLLGAESGRHVQINSPAGCEVIKSNTTIPIWWSAMGTAFQSGETVRLDYSDDSGETWHVIPGAESLAYNACSFSWNLAGSPNSAHYRVRVTALADPSVSATSRRDFQIADMGILTVQSTPMLQIPIGGNRCNSTNYTYSVVLGDSVTLTAPSMPGYNFIGWSDGQGRTLTHDDTVEFTFAADATVEAEYAPVGSERRDYYVNDDLAESGWAVGDDNNDGLSPQTPVRHIQDVIDRYADIATIHLAPGTYDENITITAADSGVRLVGAGASLTALDGGQSESCIRLAGVSDASIEALTIRNGRSERGGGIYCESSSPSVKQCVLSSNTALDYGGAVYSDGGGTVLLDGCQLVGNAARVGGAVANFGQLTSRNCTMVGNTAVYGGAMVNAAGTISVANCTLVANVASARAGALISYTGAVTYWTNTIVWDSTAPEAPVAYLHWLANMSVAFCDVENGQVDIVREGETVLEWQAGNINSSPLFAREPNDGDDGWSDNPATPSVDESANNDYGDIHLQATSPCVNAGDPTANPLARDLDGRPRLIYNSVDIGAYEFGIVGDANGDYVVDDQDASILGAHWQRQAGATWADGDFNADGKVDDRDAAIMAAHWGQQIVVETLPEGGGTASDPGTDGPPRGFIGPKAAALSPGARRVIERGVEAAGSAGRAARDVALAEGIGDDEVLACRLAWSHENARTRGRVAGHVAIIEPPEAVFLIPGA